MFATLALLPVAIAQLVPQQQVLQTPVHSTFDKALCPDPQLSCSISKSPTCCYESPGGILLQTQFWDYYPAVGADDEFTLHGLWPDNCDGSYEQFCDSSLNLKPGDIKRILVDEFNDNDLYEKMSQNWRNYNGDDASLWLHEYNKHATCINTLNPRCYASSNSGTLDKSSPNLHVYDFFRITETLYSKLPTFKFLADAGIKPDPEATYTRAQIAEALNGAFEGKQVLFKCDRNHALQEVWYFHHVRGSVRAEEFVPIDSLGHGNCPETGIKFFPKGKGPAPRPGPGNPGNPDRGYLRLSGHSGCLISNGQHYGFGTCATYRVLQSAFGGVNIRSSKGFCGFNSKGHFDCGGYSPAQYQFQRDENSGVISYGGKTAWCFDESAKHGHGKYIQTPIRLSDGNCEEFELKFR